MNTNTYASSQHPIQIRTSTPRGPTQPRPSFSCQTRKPPQRHKLTTTSSQSQYLVSNKSNSIYSNNYHHHHYNHYRQRHNIMQNPNANQLHMSYSYLAPNPYAPSPLNGNQRRALQQMQAPQVMMQQQYQYSYIPPNPYAVSPVNYQNVNHNHNRNFPLNQNQSQVQPQPHQPQNNAIANSNISNISNPLKRKSSPNSNNEPPAKKAKKNRNKNVSSEDSDDSDEGGMSLHQMLSQGNSVDVEPENQFENPYHIDQLLHVKENSLPNTLWLDCKVIDIGSAWIKVHFDGFHSKYDKKIYVDPDHKKGDKFEIREGLKEAQGHDIDLQPKQEKEEDKKPEMDIKKVKVNDKEEMDDMDIDLDIVANHEPVQGQNQNEDEEALKIKLKQEMQEREAMKTVAIHKLKEMVKISRTKLNKKQYDIVREDMEIFLADYQGKDEEIAKEHDPKNLGELYVVYSIALGQLHEYEDAVINCKKCIELSPKYHKGYTTLAALYAFQERKQEAIDQYELALKTELKPNKRDDIKRRRDTLLKDMAEAENNANGDDNHNNQEPENEEEDDDDSSSESEEDAPIQLRRRLPRQAKNGPAAKPKPVKPPSDDEDSDDSSSDSDSSSSSEDEAIVKRQRKKPENNDNLSQSQSQSPKKWIGKGEKGTDLDQRKMDPSKMSAAQKRAYENRATDPNAFYYRFNLEGD